MSARRRRELRQSTINKAAIGTLVLITGLLVLAVTLVTSAVSAEKQAFERQARLKALGIQLQAASDYLTDEARLYSVSGDRTHLAKYWDEITVTKTRDTVLAQLKELGATAGEFALIDQAKANSDALVKTESRSQRLMLEAMPARPSPTCRRRSRRPGSPPPTRRGDRPPSARSRERSCSTPTTPPTRRSSPGRSSSSSAC
nr:hypothetical protein GCM10020092_068390 [Actinoplanes digitatis]